jgi:predicted transglutaminase-like cysteine proteinase
MSRYLGALNMVSVAQTRWLTGCLLLLFSIIAAAPIPADEANLVDVIESQPATNTAKTTAVKPEKHLVVALAEPASTITSPAAIPQSPPPSATTQWPAPARFFTINQVLAQHKLAGSTSPSVRVAAINPKTVSDVPTIPIQPTRSGEPFGLLTFKAPKSLVWLKWNKVEAEIKAEAPALARCRTDSDQCTPAEARFADIIKQAQKLDGRAKLEFVNKRVNAAIRYTNDIAQWGVPDLWSPPLNANHNGSFDTGLGDCEDYAIAKYVALHEIGVSARDIQLLLVRDNAVHLDHAVLAVRQDDHWLVLDNRWSRLVEDTDLREFAPLFALNEDGVKLFAAPYAALRGIKTNASGLGQEFSAGGGVASAPDSAIAPIGSPTLPLLWAHPLPSPFQVMFAE